MDPLVTSNPSLAHGFSPELHASFLAARNALAKHISEGTASNAEAQRRNSSEFLRCEMAAPNTRGTKRLLAPKKRLHKYLALLPQVSLWK